MDQDYGLLVKNEGFVSFVHSGFGVFLDNKYANQYPKEWFTRSVDDLDDARRREFQLIESKLLQNIMGMFAHRTGGMFALAQISIYRLKMALEKRNWQEAQEICDRLERDLGRMFKQTREFRAFGSRSLADPNANTVLLEAVKEAIKRQERSGETPLDLQVGFSAETQEMRVPGEFENIVGVFAELFQNSVAHSARANPTIVVKCFYDRSTRKLICDVKDNGGGVPAEVKKYLFEPFFTTNRSSTGLGLAVVRQVMEASGGTIRETGVPGEGATFRLEFPLFAQLEGLFKQ